MIRTIIPALVVLMTLPHAGEGAPGRKRTPTSAPVPSTQPVQQARQFRSTLPGERRIEYLLYLPRDYGRKRGRWPLVLFLHGSGESGSDLQKVKRHGPPMLVEQGKAFPFLLVSPQSQGRWDSELLDALLRNLIETYDVDPDRVYCTGLSMGGFGTWALAAAHPERFAAIVPICGGGDPAALNICRLKAVPVWAFHGANDPVVPIAGDQHLVDSLKDCGGSVQFTVYPDTGHDAWTQTYRNRKLYTWLLAQRRSRPVSSAPEQ